MIIKMVNEFKFTVVHFARPNQMRICACVWIYRWTKKKLWKIRTGPPGLWAAGQPGRWASGPRGPSSRDFPGKTLMTRETAVQVKKKKINKKIIIIIIIIIINNNNTNDCHSQTSGYMGTCQIQVCSVNRWRELVDYAPINVKPAGAGGRQGMGWGFDIFQKFCRQIPSHRQIIPVNCNQISPPRTAHCCQISQGWTQ